MSKKIVITGTGRCGSSFLMHLLTCLGQDTGFTPEECVEHLERSGVNGGIEHGFDAKCRVIKNPAYIRDKKVFDYDIERVIIPFRDIKDSARSMASNGHGYGGMWKGIDTMEDQLGILILALAVFRAETIKREIPVDYINFPQMVTDPDYLYEKLNPIFNLDRGKFDEVFALIADPSKITIK